MEQEESRMSIKSDKREFREARENGFENVEIGLQRALEGANLQNDGERQALEIAMMGDGSQAMPEAHCHLPRRMRIVRDIADILPSDALNPEQTLMARENEIEE